VCPTVKRVGEGEALCAALSLILRENREDYAQQCPASSGRTGRTMRRVSLILRENREDYAQSVPHPKEEGRTMRRVSLTLRRGYLSAQTVYQPGYTSGCNRCSNQGIPQGV